MIAGLAGINASHLSRIENGERALDSRSLTVSLANALQIAPSELTRLPVPAPANGHSEGAGIEMLAAGAFDLARGELDSMTVPTNTSEGLQLNGMLALSSSLVAAADKRPSDAHAALSHATELAQHTGQGNAFLMGFGPANVGIWTMAAALEYERGMSWLTMMPRSASSSSTSCLTLSFTRATVRFPCPEQAAAHRV